MQTIAVCREMFRSSRYVAALLIMLLAPNLALGQACVGDCDGDGQVTVDEIIIGVNIALGVRPLSDCMDFDRNASGEVEIDELILAVDFALGGCPAVPTATFTATTGAILTPTPSPSEVPPALTPTPSATQTVTETETPPEPTATEPEPTATQPEPTATEPEATVTPPEPTATQPEPTATQPEPTATQPEATATQPEATATPSEPTATATETATPEATGTATETPEVTDTPEPIETPQATETPQQTETPGVPTTTPTQDGTANSQFVAGRATLIANSMTALNSVVSSILVSVNGSPSSSLVARSTSASPVVNQCPISGTSSRDCEQTGSNVQLTIAATDCVAAGPAGGTANFNGNVSLDGTGVCPVPFGGAFIIDLGVVITPVQGPPLTISATLNGDLTAGLDLSNPCLVAALGGTITGALSATLPDGTGTFITFDHTTFAFSDPTYDNDCVPLRYTFTFDGPATLGDAQSGVGYGVTFQGLSITQDAQMTPVTVAYEGGIQSDCVGSLLILDTVTPVAVASGELCPRDGQITISDGTTSSVYYRSDGSVDLDTNNDGTVDTSYSSCLAPELLACNGPLQ